MRLVYKILDIFLNWIKFDPPPPPPPKKIAPPPSLDLISEYALALEL